MDSSNFDFSSFGISTPTTTATAPTKSPVATMDDFFTNPSTPAPAPASEELGFFGDFNFSSSSSSYSAPLSGTNSEASLTGNDSWFNDFPAATTAPVATAPKSSFSIKPAPAKPDPVDPSLSQLGAILDMDEKGILDTPKPKPQPKVAPAPTPVVRQQVSNPKQQFVNNPNPNPKQPKQTQVSHAQSNDPFTREETAVPVAAPSASVFDAVSSKFNAAVGALAATVGIEDGSSAPSVVTQGGSKKKLGVNWTAENIIVAVVDGAKIVSSTGGFAKHYTFRVSGRTQTQLKHFIKNSYQTVRSPSDFEWLHSHLTKRFPYLLIPPVPTQQNAFSELLSSEDEPNRLARQFELFLLRIGRNLTLCQSSDVAAFFILSKEEYQKEKEKKWNYVDLESIKTSNNSFSFFSTSPQPKDATLLQAYKEILAWKEQLKGLEKIAQNLQIKHRELSSEYRKWEAEIIKFAESPSLVRPTSGIRLAGNATSTLRGFSEAFARTSESSTGQAAVYGIILTEKVNSWVNYARAAQQLIERYATIEQNYLSVESAYKSKKEKLDALTAKQAAVGGMSRSDIQTMQELSQTMKTMEPAMQQQLTYYNKVKQTIWEELKRYDKHKVFEAHHWVELFGERQSNLLGNVVKEWTKFSLSIK
eukprot:TRINITY_DN6629_c0_g1_i1.p1 TRINITY_DN6629_c0_g1~~TRINITY_DN6629_c0_g1_i1.p1  ORF type:complete len:741 (+),score=186.31 TRINITY_DN6629_c0_g1_i1:289-2223(+)